MSVAKNRVRASKLDEAPNCGACGTRLPAPDAPIEAGGPALQALIAEASWPVLVANGTLDDIMQPAQVAAAPERLPAHTRFTPIEGGDHYQFGSFAKVPVTATISREDQQQQARTALLGFLNEVEA